MTETEEFEFRRRLEQEQAAAQAQPEDSSKSFSEMTPIEKFNAATKMVMMGQPVYWANKGLEKVGEEITRAAYDAGGRVTDALANRKYVPEVPVGNGGLAEPQPFSPDVAAAAGGLTNLGVEALPVLAGNAVGKLASPSMVAKAENLMQQALKPSKAALKSGDAARAVKTLLEEGANVSEGGVAKLTGKIDELDDALDLAIKGSKGTLNNVSVLKPLKQVMDQYRAGTMAEENLQEIRKVAKKLLDHPSLRGSEEMTVEFAQAMKRQNYKELGGKAYGMGLKPDAERDALKAVTRGLKEGIEGQSALDAEYLGLPNAARINAQMGPLVNARDLALERVLMAGNRDQLGLATLAKNPAAALAMLADRSPLVKSILARMLYAGREGIPRTAGAVGGGILGGTAGQDEGILSP